MDWTLSTIQAKIRKLTGRPDTSQLSDADLVSYINQMYTDILPLEVQTKEVEDWFALSVTEALGGSYDTSDEDIQYVLPGNTTCVDSDDASFPVDLTTDYATFFDLYPEDYTTTGRPLDMLLYDQKIYLRPLPDASYTVKFPYVKKITTELANSSDKPLDPTWGPYIAYGAAIEIFIDGGEAVPTTVAAMYQHHEKLIARKQILQTPVGTRAAPRF